MESTGAQFSNELQKIDSMIEHQDSGTNDGHNAICPI